MHNHLAVAIIAILILAFGLVSQKAEKTPLTAPMFFVAIGIVLSPLGLNLLNLEINAEITRTIAEITLIIILFVDASFIKLKHMRARLQGIPFRLLGIGLPLTMLSGVIVGMVLFPQWNLWLVALLALILSPTDAALGQAVVKSESVPIKVRESISIESGLNDGIALPPILVCIAVLSSVTGTISQDDHWLAYTAKQLTFGPLVGCLVGIIGGKLVEQAARRQWMEPVFQRLAAISLALLAFSGAELLHGNGFIAAFCAGLFLSVKNEQVRERIQEFGETEGQLLTLFVFFILGLFAIPNYMQYWTAEIWVYALLSLTVIRMAPVFICLIGSDTNFYSKCFIAWFGPRGIASILYMLLVISELGGEQYAQMLSVIVLTVTLSVFAHGVTAVGMSNRFSKVKESTK